MDNYKRVSELRSLTLQAYRILRQLRKVREMLLEAWHWYNQYEAYRYTTMTLMIKWANRHKLEWETAFKEYKYWLGVLSEINKQRRPLRIHRSGKQLSLF